MSIKILQITAAYKPAYIYGGPTMSVAKLCETLIGSKEQGAKNKDEFELEVFTTTANGITELNVTPNQSSEVDGVKVTYFKRLTKDHTHFSPSLLLALRKRIKKSKPKQLTNQQTNQLVIHIHAWWNLVSIFSCAIAKWYKIPVLLSPRGMLTDYTASNRNGVIKSIIHMVIGKSLLKYCHIHVTSEKEKRDVFSITTPKSITLIPNLVELKNEKACLPHRQVVKNKEEGQSSTERPTFKFIFLSRIEEKKGLEILFEALSSLSFEWNLTIAGSGEKKYVESLKFKVESLKIENRIDWVGQIKNEDKFKLLADHDLMALTSYNENFANVVIESLSVGTAVLLSNEVGLADYVEEKKLGWITHLTIEDIKKNINTAFESVSFRNIIRETAPQLISEDFNSQNLIKKYFNLYSKLPNGRL